MAEREWQQYGKDAKDIRLLEAFKEKHKADPVYVRLAEGRIEELKKKQVVVVPPKIIASNSSPSTAVGCSSLIGTWHYTWEGPSSGSDDWVFRPDGSIVYLRWPRLFGQFFRFDKWNLYRGLGCQADWQHAVGTEVSLIWGHAVKARVRTAPIVKIEVASDRGARVRYAVVGTQVDLLVLYGSP
jgi:hypothetical protein